MIRRNAFPVNKTMVNVGGVLYPVTRNFVVKPSGEQRILLPIQDKFIIKEAAPPNGFIFEFYNSPSDASIVSAAWRDMLENAMTTSGQIWTGTDAWQSHQLEVRIRADETQWRWDFFPHANMQYVKLYSTISGAGNRNWVRGVPTMQQEISGNPARVNGVTSNEVFNHPGLLRDAMWHPMPVNFPFPHLQWRESIGHPGRLDEWRDDMWVWNFEYHCHCRWWDDIPCTCVLYPDFVCWLRGDDISRLSWWFREMEIDDTLFPPSTQGWTWNPTGGSFGGGQWVSNRTSGIKRLSLDHWNRPWKRYPNLM